MDKDDRFMHRNIPPTMRAVELRAYDGRPASLALVEKPIPRPGANEVLVRIGAAPVNPSDLMFLRGLYGQKKSLPVVPGFEGSGEVVATGRGWRARLLSGRRVACAAPFTGDGTWAEYMTTPAELCIPLRSRIDLEQGAALIVNPLTAWALMDIAKKGRHPALAQTAAASALGRMIIRLAKRRDVPLLNIVRRQEQVELLQQQEGARHVLDSSAPEFGEQLRARCRQLRVGLAFDAVAGEMTGHVLHALPKGGRIVVYGALAGEACRINPGSLIFEAKSCEGFWLSEWLRSRSLLSTSLAAWRVQQYLADDLRTIVQARLPLEEAARGLHEYARRMTDGKIFLIPHLRAGSTPPPTTPPR